MLMHYFILRVGVCLVTTDDVILRNAYQTDFHNVDHGFARR